MALPTKIRLQIVSADRSLVNEQVDEVVVPGLRGYFGVLPGHAPLLGVLGIGELKYRQGTQWSYLLIANGFAEVQPDHVTILAEVAEKPEDIDVNRADAARKRAELRLAAHQEDLELERARVALQKALVRLQVALRGGVRS